MQKISQYKPNGLCPLKFNSLWLSESCHHGVLFMYIKLFATTKLYGRQRYICECNYRLFLCVDIFFCKEVCLMYWIQVRQRSMVISELILVPMIGALELGRNKCLIILNRFKPENRKQIFNVFSKRISKMYQIQASALKKSFCLQAVCSVKKYQNLEFH